MSKAPFNSPRVSRRDLLRAGGAGAVGFGLSQTGLAGRANDSSPRAILILLDGGPSPFETFDPKPDAPMIVRGPFRSIATKIPGVRLSETLPGIAERLDRLCLIRSLTSQAPPLHQAGMQLLLSGRLAMRKEQLPKISELVEQGLAARGEQSSCLEIDDRSVEFISPGQRVTNPMDAKFQSALQAVQSGTRLAVVHTADMNQPGNKTWDCHGRGKSPATVFDYRDTLCPQFDAAFSTLVDHLTNSGLIANTLVIVAGELGKSSRVNSDCGRDDSAGVWSALVAGGNLPAGAVIGASDALGREPAEHPISIQAIPGLILNWLQLDPALMARGCSANHAEADSLDTVAALAGGPVA